MLDIRKCAPALPARAEKFKEEVRKMVRVILKLTV